RDAPPAGRAAGPARAGPVPAGIARTAAPLAAAAREGGRQPALAHLPLGEEAHAGAGRRAELRRAREPLPLPGVDRRQDVAARAVVALDCVRLDGVLGVLIGRAH